jgi:hypothetical protein
MEKLAKYGRNFLKLDKIAMEKIKNYLNRPKY